MTRKTAVYLPLTFLCGTLLLTQNWQPTDRNWTDKNNTEKYAAYLLQMTYYQQGYVGARVEIKQDGSKRLFIMEPGEVFHLNDVVITGPHDSVQFVMGRICDFLASQRVRYRRFLDQSA